MPGIICKLDFYSRRKTLMRAFARCITAKAEDMMPTAVAAETSTGSARAIHSVPKIPSGSIQNADKIPISRNDYLW